MMIRIFWLIVCLALANNQSAFGNESSSEFYGFKSLSQFKRTKNASGEVVWLSPRIKPRIDWDELIASWNAASLTNGFLKIEARVIQGDHHVTKFYTLGLWSDNSAIFPRESVSKQGDGDGDVRTDTLALKKPGGEIELRLTATGPEARKARIKFVGVCVSRAAAGSTLPASKASTGPVLIPVPEYSQMPYPGGEQWCSPTSTAMVLAFWSQKLSRPELAHTVPEVASAVFDKKWPGTGNWPFNTAYAGSFKGMRAFVTRFDGVTEIEQWVNRGLPVVASVNYAWLKGKQGNDGHLVVCVGFTEKGDPIINDPGTTLNVRKTFPRENLIKAWAHSRNTVYLIYPESASLPPDEHHHWTAR